MEIRASTDANVLAADFLRHAWSSVPSHEIAGG